MRTSQTSLPVPHLGAPAADLPPRGELQGYLGLSRVAGSHRGAQSMSTCLVPSLLATRYLFAYYCLSAYQPTCLPAYLPTCLPTYLPLLDLPTYSLPHSRQPPSNYLSTKVVHSSGILQRRWMLKARRRSSARAGHRIVSPLLPHRPPRPSAPPPYSPPTPTRPIGSSDARKKCTSAPLTPVT